jgi:hypothetical protein
VPFFVVAWQRVERTAAGAEGVAGVAGIAVIVAADGEAGTGGLQLPQGPYLAAASASGISILLARSELHEAR